MERKLSVAELPINASPAAMHHRQMFRQVWLPLIASIIIFLILVILTLIGAAQKSPLIEKWGNLSAIYVIIPVLFSGLILLVLLGGSIYGMRKLLLNMPRWMMIAQMRIASLAVMIRRAANAATRPVFSAHLSSARARALWKQFFH